MQSAGFEDYSVVGSPSPQRSMAASTSLFSRLGTTDLDALRHAPAESVREASLALSGIFPPPGQVHTPANLTWYPVIDDTVVTADFSGWPKDVPVMLGCTQDEARFFVQPTMLYAHPEIRPEDAYTADTLAHMARALAGDRADAVLAHYADNGMTPYEAIADLITAGVWHEPAEASLERFEALGRTCFAYRFARVSPGGLQSGLLAQHSVEIPYLFGTLMPAQAYDETDAAVSRDVQHAWTEFARTGTPRSLDGIAWPAYRSDAPELALIGDTTHRGARARTPITELIAASRVVATGR
jgi:para-nitrobenzyl esterase